MVVRFAVGIAAGALIVAAAASAGFQAPSAHLLPADPAAPGAYGESVAVSGDGNTALVGGDRSGSSGAVVVYVRSGSNWTKQAVLTPTDLTANASFGATVALSADGNTALVGDNGSQSVAICTTDGACSSGSGLPSAVWVFARSAGTWTQQGPALSPPSARGVSAFGSSLALSADGNTALVGAHLEAHTGAAWVFTRSGSVWKRQGTKLTVADEVGRGSFGWSVALSWDGDTALIGAPSDSEATDEFGNLTDVGAAWVFTRTGSGWKQQGGKLTGPGGVVPEFGRTVALSGDGGTALIGGDMDGGFPAYPGAVWTFTRSGSSWKQQGPKLLLTDPADQANGFGSTLALSAGGNTALIGSVSKGYRYVWQFARTAGGWKQDAQLHGPTGIEFGQTMALTPTGETAFIGTSDGAGPGSVYVFDSAAAASEGSPSIVRIVPDNGATGAKLTISGRNLTGAAVVQVGQVGVPFTVVSPTKVVATVPASAVTGKVTILTPDGTATSPQSFTVG